jgi:hypothetical protein
VTYLHAGTPISAWRPLSLDISRPTFVRLEVYEALPFGGYRPLLFSNPIVFTDEMP